jgi:hypothetical protein
MDVLKANAMDFARRIDELRSLLAGSAKADAQQAKVIIEQEVVCDTSPVPKQEGIEN